MSVCPVRCAVAAGLRACCFVLLAGVSFLLLAGCGQAPPEPAAPPVVKAMRLSMQPASGERTYSGVVVARHEVVESFRVGGRIAKRLVDVGDRVAAGQVLATLDESDLRLSMESALAERTAALSNRTKAIADEQRYATLLARGVVSQSEYDARHLVADEARGRMDEAEHALGLARNALGYAGLRSSSDGVVTAVGAEAGQVVAAGQAVVTVAQKGELEVRADIPERFIGTLKEFRAEVSLWADSGARYPATLRETAPAADAATRTYAVRFTLRNPGPEVHLGMTAVLHLAGPAGTPVARIPSSALFNQGGGPGVWVVDSKTGQLAFRPVVVDRYLNRDALVRGEIADGEFIVVAGVQKLDAGMVVRLADSSEEVSR